MQLLTDSLPVLHMLVLLKHPWQKLYCLDSTTDKDVLIIS